MTYAGGRRSSRGIKGEKYHLMRKFPWIVSSYAVTPFHLMRSSFAQLIDTQ
jgi:hypothetical protein